MIIIPIYPPQLESFTSVFDVSIENIDESLTVFENRQPYNEALDLSAYLGKTSSEFTTMELHEIPASFAEVISLVDTSNDLDFHLPFLYKSKKPIKIKVSKITRLKPTV